jgi:hypothetical protein
MRQLHYFTILLLLCLLGSFSLAAQSPIISFDFSGNITEGVSGKQPSVNGIKLNQDRFGIAKSAVSFDGTQSALWIPSDNAFNTQHTTISMWVRVNEIPVQGEMFLLSYGGWQERYKVSVPNHGKPVWTTNTSNGIVDVDAGDNHEMKPGIWQHWVFVQDGTKDLIYLDGQLANSKDAPGDLNNTTASFGFGYNPIDNANFFNGSIDDIKVFGEALDATQIFDLYTAESTAPGVTPQMVANYKMDGSGQDFSSFGNHATVTNVGNHTDRFGFGKSSMGFDGALSTFVASNSNALNSDYTTISFWINANTLPPSGEAFVVSNGGWQQRFKISVPSHGKLVFTTNSTSGISDMDAGGGNEIIPGKWTHVVAIHDGTKDKIFINGTLANSKDVAGALNDTEFPLGIGFDAIDNGSFFDGNIDEVQIYNYAMSDQDVADLYTSQSTFTGSASDIAASYLFNSNNIDDSQYKNDADGNVTYTKNRFGWANNAAHFDGTSSVSATNSIALNSDYATYSLWVNLDELPPSGEAFLISNGGWQQRVKISVPNHGKVVFTTNASSGISDMDAGDGHAIVPGQWTHIVAVHDGTDDIIYINGVETNRKAVAGTLNHTTAVLGLGWNPIDGGNFMKGSLDDVTIYNRALSSAEIADLYNAQKDAPTITDPLVANYTFSGNTDDSSPYKNNANANGAQVSKDRFDNANQAFSFDGASNEMTASNSEQQNSDFTSIAFWINAKNIPATGEAFILSNGGWQERWKISLPSHGKLVFTTNNSSGISDMDSGGSSITPGAWTHVVMTHDGVNDKIYFNGLEVASKAVAGTLNSTTHPLGIGYNPIDGGNYFEGSLDEIRIYNIALNDAEVAALYAEQSVEQPQLDVDAPSTPLDITADVKNTNVQLNWSPSEDNVGVVAYNVYQDGSVVATTSETGHKLVDLSPLTLYSFGVSAVDAAGNESGISTLQVTTGEDETPDTTPPTAPGNLDGTAGAHSVLLFWEASTDDREVKGYVVSVDGFVYDTLAGNAVSVLVNNLDAETLYSFEVYAFDRAGNNSEVSEVTLSTTKEVDAGEAGLVAYYPFEGNANDATPYANHGVIGGDATFETTTHPNGGAQNIKFDGVQDSVLVPNAVQLISDFATIAFWIRVDEVNPNDAEAYVLDFGHWSERWKISLPKHTRIVFTTNSKTTQFPSLISDMDSKDGNEMVPGFWWHVIMTHDGVNNRIYVNGEMVNEVSAPGLLNSTALPFCMASNPVEGGQYFHGALDEIKLYNKAITAEEASKLFNSGTTGTKSMDDEMATLVESVYPNPTTDKIWVEHRFNSAASMLIRVMDVQGRQVGAIRYSAGTLPAHRIGVSTSNLSPGVYYLNFVSDEHSLGSVKFQVK